MKYVQTTKVLERGILTSAYKKNIKNNIRLEKRASISAIRSLILDHHENVESQIGSVLRVSVFAITIVMITF
ncbi:MAG: hypothetical protein ACJA17_000879 [Polaribacter sp.]|jgi:hypothetical protein